MTIKDILGHDAYCLMRVGGTSMFACFDCELVVNDPALSREDTRISDKEWYVGPTRGQLGSALKTLWPACSVELCDLIAIERDVVNFSALVTELNELDPIHRLPVISRQSIPESSPGDPYVFRTN